MASQEKSDLKSVDLTQVEVLYARRAVELLVSSLKRGLLKEVPGSEIYDLRSRELRSLSALLLKFGG